MSSAEAHRKYHTLDGMRGIAALSVVSLHSPDYFGPFVDSSGYLAVDFFFLLSGFIIANAYGRRIRAGMTVSDFFKIRFIRFYPLYLLGLVLGLLVAIARILREAPIIPTEVLPAVVLFGLFMLPLPGLFGMLGYPLNGPAWTLFLELAVNVLYAAIVPRLSKALLAVIIVSSACGLVLAAVQFGTLHVGWKMDSIWAGVPRVSFSFFLGVLIFQMPLPRFATAVPPWLVLCLLAVVLWIIPSAAVRPYYDLFTVLAAFPMLLVAGVGNEPVARARATYTFLGATSYAVYAIHAPLSILTHGALSVVHVPFKALFPYLAIGFWVLLLSAAWLADRYYDLPLRRAAMMRLRRPRPA